MPVQPFPTPHPVAPLTMERVAVSAFTVVSALGRGRAATLAALRAELDVFHAHRKSVVAIKAV